MNKIYVRMILEMIGGPKDFIEKALKEAVEKIKEEKAINIVRDQQFEAKKIKEQPFWSCFAEIEAEFKKVENLIGFCFDYMPSSIEILEPSNFSIEGNELSGMLNDLLIKLHQYVLAIKNLQAKTILLEREKEKKD